MTRGAAQYSSRKISCSLVLVKAAGVDIDQVGIAHHQGVAIAEADVELEQCDVLLMPPPSPFTLTVAVLVSAVWCGGRRLQSA